MEEILIPMKDGKKIYTRIYNNDHKETLLYLHGGPGASCSSFQHVAYKLSKHINVVLIDQRGVLRSDKLEKDDKCDVDILVDDCEGVRKFLNINKFIVVGQSFGGFLALLYATKYPKSIEKVIFENPSLDFSDSIKLIQSKAIDILEKKGQSKLAENLKNNINNIEDIKHFVYKWIEIPDEFRNQVYYLKPWEEYTQEQKNMLKVTVNSDEQWQNSFTHFQMIMEDKNTYKNIINLISELQCKSLLICGEFDPVFSKEYINYYEQNVVDSKVSIVKNCGHFVHTDRPEEYVQMVLEFVN